jgi:hypothetical protein
MFGAIILDHWQELLFFVKRQANVVIQSLASMVISNSYSQTYNFISDCIATFIHSKMQ